MSLENSSKFLLNLSVRDMNGEDKHICRFEPSASPVFAQARALNRRIEGAVQDQTDAPAANDALTVTNTETGATLNNLRKRR